MDIDPKWLSRMNRAVPRYTSYPTAMQFRPVDESLYRTHLQKIGQDPISLYIHLPFCRSMCLYCGCSVVLNRRPERQSLYLDWLLHEISLVSEIVKAPVSQLHLGGGTPTSLTLPEFDLLLSALRRSFRFEPTAELSIEIDPRTVHADGGEKLKALKKLGFNRVSFGVQDLDPKVQEAVKRRQSEEVSWQTFALARELAFDGINIDLIYGLPFQTVSSFTRTVETIASWQPDRIALFSYAKVPWLKKHQQAIPEHTLPSTEEKLDIYRTARRLFIERGYTGIGMDHFALNTDSLTLGYHSGKLYRNFQGYSLNLAENLIGLGMSSIGFVEGAYFHNHKDLASYGALLEERRLPVAKGLVLSPEDRLRRWVIQELMCRFQVDKKQCETLFSINFDLHFKDAPLEPLKAEGLLEETPEKLIPTPLGKLLIRLVASAFDEYLAPGLAHSQLV